MQKSRKIIVKNGGVLVGVGGVSRSWLTLTGNSSEHWQ